MTTLRFWFAALLLGTLAACSSPSSPDKSSAADNAGAASAAGAPADTTNSPLRVVAEIKEPQMVAVAVTSGGRMFGTFPRWDHNPVNPVAEFNPDGRTVKPYPTAGWCMWNDSVKNDPKHHWICPQGIIVDKTGMLWVLDPAAPGMKFVVAGGPKLVKIDPKTNQVLQNISFGPDLAPAKAYLNDVRVDTDKQIAYLTESNLGGIIVYDLKAQKGRRLLTGHPSVKPDKSLVLKAGDEQHPMIDAQGKPMLVASDGIALSPDGQYLYWHPLTGHRAYRIKTEALRNPALTEAQLGQQVEDLGEVPASDGMEIDAKGNLYMTAFEQNAVVRRTPEGKIETVVKDRRLEWPDSFCFLPDGTVYVTASAIHKGATWNKGVARQDMPYRAFKMKLPQ